VYVPMPLLYQVLWRSLVPFDTRLYNSITLVFLDEHINNEIDAKDKTAQQHTLSPNWLAVPSMQTTRLRPLALWPHSIVSQAGWVVASAIGVALSLGIAFAANQGLIRQAEFKLWARDSPLFPLETRLRGWCAIDERKGGCVWWLVLTSGGLTDEQGRITGDTYIHRRRLDQQGCTLREHMYISKLSF
jgi:hypothetical protein